MYNITCQKSIYQRRKAATVGYIAVVVVREVGLNRSVSVE